MQTKCYCIIGVRFAGSLKQWAKGGKNQCKSGFAECDECETADLENMAKTGAFQEKFGGGQACTYQKMRGAEILHCGDYDYTDRMIQWKHTNNLLWSKGFYDKDADCQLFVPFHEF